MQERHQSRQQNKDVFRELWGQEPRLIKIRMGPMYLVRGAEPGSGHIGQMEEDEREILDMDTEWEEEEGPEDLS